MKTEKLVWHIQKCRQPVSLAWHLICVCDCVSNNNNGGSNSRSNLQGVAFEQAFWLDEKALSRLIGVVCFNSLELIGICFIHWVMRRHHWWQGVLPLAINTMVTISSHHQVFQTFVVDTNIATYTLPPNTEHIFCAFLRRSICCGITYLLYLFMYYFRVLTSLISPPVILSHQRAPSDYSTIEFNLVHTV